MCQRMPCDVHRATTLAGIARRGARVYLTAKGRQLVDRAVVARFAEAERLLQGMTGKDRARLEVQLRDLLLQLGGAATEPR